MTTITTSDKAGKILFEAIRASLLQAFNSLEISLIQRPDELGKIEIRITKKELGEE